MTMAAKQLAWSCLACRDRDDMPLRVTRRGCRHISTDLYVHMYTDLKQLQAFDKTAVKPHRRR